MYLATVVFQEPSLLRLHYVQIISDAVIAVAAFWLAMSLVVLAIQQRRDPLVRVQLITLCAFLSSVGFTFVIRMFPVISFWMLVIEAVLLEVAAMTGLAASILMIRLVPRILRIPDPSADGLTGLSNRIRFDERLEQALNREQLEKAYHFAVLFIDLDGFKAVNDDLGHGVGDELLRAVARRLQGIVRGRDLVARYGGDEFTVLLDEIPDLEFAERIATRIIETVQQPFVINGHGVRVGASIGIVTSSGNSNARQIIGAADQAMYRAKTTRRGSYEVWKTAPLASIK